MANILHVGKFYPPQMGGTEIYNWQLASQQARTQNVRVLAAGNRPFSSRENVRDVEVVRMATFGSISSMPVTPLLGWHIGTSRADLIHMHMPNPCAAASLFLSAHPAPLILTHHADTLRDHAESGGRPFYRWLSAPLVHRTMQRAQAVIVTSQSYLDSSAELQTFRDKCHVIPLGIDPTPFSSAHPQTIAGLRMRYGWKIITCIGRLVRIKGFEYAIRAMPRLDANLLIVGDGPLLNELQALARHLGVANRVFFLGARDNRHIPAILGATDVFVFPSTQRNEAFGLVQLEAMASGVPVVNTWLASGVPEVSLDRQTGFTVDPQSAEALIPAIHTLLKDRELRARFGAEAVRRVHQEYTLDLMLRRTAELYQHVLSTANAGSFPAYREEDCTLLPLQH